MIFSDYLDASLAGLSVLIVTVVVIYAVIDIRKALRSPTSTTIEVGGVPAMAGGDGD